ncbi:hypothetical protein STRAU_1857 [Streptomyces aurantiacus JA 4570]|uniref:Uncharacterized protein n=1 Tax=Streptomyces aurantiacus JA 4570 TaxID=1286094 RepID=S4A325_9ACTN|nr:hypothetical protein STRAU_1857 [Streptomyces aurantiacus JA 4570]
MRRTPPGGGGRAGVRSAARRPARPGRATVVASGGQLA